MPANIINLATPVAREKVRDFQPPWRTVFVYRCAAGHTVKVRANSFRGKTPVPSVGAITCPQCEVEDDGRHGAVRQW